jgi:hypothetical protein
MLGRVKPGLTHEDAESALLVFFPMKEIGTYLYG